MTFYDPDLEESFIGGILARPSRLGEYARQVQVQDFYALRHRALWAALLELHQRGDTIDVVTVADAARRHGSAIEAADALSLIVDSLPPSATALALLRRHRLSRDLQGLAHETIAALEEGDDPAQVAQKLAAHLADAQRPSSASEPEATTMEEILESAESSSPWILPGLIRQDWRIVFVAAEGVGKSVLFRQLAIAAAQGIHPLWPQRTISPVRALIVDLENPKAAIAETASRMVEQAKREVGDAYDPQRLKVWRRPRGIDLRTPVDAGALEREIAHHKPGLVCLGPLYKASVVRSGERYEESAAGVQDVLDDLRIRYGFALILEHHAPQASHGVRDMRPEGSSWWLRWPEMGMTLHAKNGGPDVTVGKYRLHRLQAQWPETLVRGTTWPWVGRWDTPTARVAEMANF